VPGGYIVSGLSDSVGVYTDAWVLRVGPDGRIAEGCHADRGRESVVARPLPLTRVPYELRGDGESATPRSVVVVDTNVAAATPNNVVTARQCVGAATQDAGPSATPRSLTVRQSGTSTGVVTSVPGGIVCGTDGGGVCSAPYADGSLVTLRVDFGSIDRFVQWGPGCEPLTGGSDDVCLVRLDADKTIDVYFNTPSAPPPRPPLGEFTLSVSVDRLGSYVGSTDGSFGCQVSGGQPRTCSVRYPAGRIVDLYAAPLPGGGALFENWAGDCSSFGAQPNISLTMNRDYSCRAQFVTAP
jgi:hypothetical protein